MSPYSCPAALHLSSCLTRFPPPDIYSLPHSNSHLTFGLNFEDFHQVFPASYRNSQSDIHNLKYFFSPLFFLCYTISLGFRLVNSSMYHSSLVLQVLLEVDQHWLVSQRRAPSLRQVNSICSPVASCLGSLTGINSVPQVPFCLAGLGFSFFLFVFHGRFKCISIIFIVYS